MSADAYASLIGIDFASHLHFSFRFVEGGGGGIYLFKQLLHTGIVDFGLAMR